MGKKTCLAILFSLCLSVTVLAQYPPPAGQPGSTAIHHDSSVIIGWATTGIDVVRGYINIADTNVQYFGNNRASFGTILYISGPSDEYVMSLGDGGSVVLTFEEPIGNGAGADFAVFENSFTDTFLELAFVEVSSDGTRFVRFPAVSLTSQTVQVGTFGNSDATKIHNLAGKYRGQYGVPFDLEDLKDSIGVNLNHITHVKIIDAVGYLQSPFVTFDSQGNKINDPWPTPFDTGGFDLESIGVIHYGPNSVDEIANGISVRVYPNPVIDNVYFLTGIYEPAIFTVSDLTGRIILSGNFINKGTFDLSRLKKGVYIGRFSLSGGSSVTRKIVKD